MTTDAVVTPREAWQDGPPPGRFDDDAPDVVTNGAPQVESVREPYTPPPVDATGRRHGASDDTDAEPSASPWGSLVIPAPAEWYTSKPPARDWLLRDARRPKADGVLPLGKVGQLIAEGGAGKTMAAFQLAISVATLVPWLGTFDVAILGPPGDDGKRTIRPGRVLVIVGEEDAAECHRRLHRARNAADAPVPEDGRIVVLPLAGVPCAMLEHDEQRNLRSAPFLLWLRSYVEAHGAWDLIIIDPLSRFAGPDAEIDNAAATRFIQSLESIATLTGATVLVCHHTNKLSRKGGAIEASAGRGSSALVDGVRWQCALGVERLTFEGDPDAQERLGTLVTWANPKTNYSRRAADLLLRHAQEHGGALVPLAEDDLIEVESARNADPSAARRTAREADHEQTREARVRKDAERRQASAAAREEATRRRDADDDAAARRMRAEYPNDSERSIIAKLRQDRACGGDRAHAAVVRTRSATPSTEIDS